MRRPRRRKSRRKDGTFKSHDYRTHPAKRFKPGPGICTWCRVDILKKDGTPNLARTFCSPRCVTEYKLRTDPAVMRLHIFFRDEGRCADCGKQHFYVNTDWQADHIEPLAEAHGDPAYWEPENVQLLCTDPCHKRKSAADQAKFGPMRELAKGPKLRRSAPVKRVRLADRLR